MTYRAAARCVVAQAFRPVKRGGRRTELKLCATTDRL